jgi:AraC-like DNA-binding protein
MIHAHQEPGAPAVAATELRDLTVHSPRTKFRGVKALNVDARPWIDPFPVCPALNQYHLVHIGIMEAAAPTRIVRTNQSTTYFLATVSGKGKVLIDGNWRLCESGSACLLPAHTLNAFHAVSGARWKFCWACYGQPQDQRPITSATSPVYAQFEFLPLLSAIEGLLHEARIGCQPSIIQSWIDLVHSYVMRFAQPAEQDDRLRLLWDRVSAGLNEEWTLQRLTEESGYSREHLRRLCQSQIGRGPMHQVTNLRMRRAAELLARTSQTIEAISLQVGYQNAFVFSNAFKKWIGWRPSEYRMRQIKNV